jgi:hypothetical protein
MPRFDPEKLESGEPEPTARFSVAGHLLDAVRQVEDAKLHLALVGSALSHAQEAARREARPCRDLRILGAEIDILYDLLDEKEADVIQRIALEETGSFG